MRCKRMSVMAAGLIFVGIFLLTSQATQVGAKSIELKLATKMPFQSFP
jgi:hypothetical protein